MGRRRWFDGSLARMFEYIALTGDGMLPINASVAATKTAIVLKYKQSSGEIVKRLRGSEAAMLGPEPAKPFTPAPKVSKKPSLPRDTPSSSPARRPPPRA